MTKTKNSKFYKNYIDILKKNKHDKNNTKLLYFELKYNENKL